MNLYFTSEIYGTSEDNIINNCQQYLSSFHFVLKLYLSIMPLPDGALIKNPDQNEGRGFIPE